MDQKSCSHNLMEMDISTSANTLQVEQGQACSVKNLKREHSNYDLLNATKRPKLIDMVFYDEKQHAAAVLHELRSDITHDKYIFDVEEISPKKTRFRCTLTIDQNVLEPVTAIGHGRSKQLAKSMAAQQALIKLYPTYRPPPEAILHDDSDRHQPFRDSATISSSSQNDSVSLVDSIRKYLTTKSMATKTPLQLFNELFINNQRLNFAISTKNRIELVDNDENLVVVCVSALNQQFWSVSSAKSVAQNDACQQAIETLCNVSFRKAKTEFINALRSMNKITVAVEFTKDNNNNESASSNNDNVSKEQNCQEKEELQQTTAELTSIPGVSSSFLLPIEEI